MPARRGIAPIRTLHVATGLDVGGAERMLEKLLRNIDASRFPCSVVSLSTMGAIGPRLIRAGIPVLAIEMSSQHWFQPGPFWRLRAHVREQQPDVVVCWMYHANLIGGLAARLAGVRNVIWGVRHATANPDGLRPRTAAIVRFSAKLSHVVPSVILYNAEASRLSHEQLGFARDRAMIIPNGFDLDSFRPDPEGRNAIRRELRLAEDTPLVGLVARLDPIKDHANFLRAAALVHEAHPNVHFVLAGSNVVASDPGLSKIIEATGLGPAVHLLGHRNDVEQLTAALDIAVSASRGEAFSNALGEAMACGVPCVTTAVGDSADIVGDAGISVPPGNAAALAGAISSLLSDDAIRARLGQAGRDRALRLFSIPAVAARYVDLLEKLVGVDAAPSAVA